MENSGNPRVSQSQGDAQSMKLELEARREKEAERRKKDAERKVEERLCKKLKLQSENKELELLRSFSNNLLEDYIKLKDKYKKLKEVNAKQRDLVAAVAAQFVEQNLPNDGAFGGTAWMVGMPGMAGSGAHAPMFPMGNQQGLFNAAAMGKDGLGAGGSSSQTAGWPGMAGMVGMLGMAGSGAHGPMFPMGNQQGLFNAAAMGGLDKDGLGAGGSFSQTVGGPWMAGMVGMAGSGCHASMLPMGNQQGLFNAAAMDGFDKDGLGAGGSSSKTAVADFDPFAQF